MRLTFLAALLLTITTLSVLIYNTETEKKAMKNDLIELSKIKYGLFSVDEWKVILSNLIVKKVEELRIDDANRDEMRKKISQLLYAAIDEFENNFSQRSTSGIRGALENIVASTFGIFGKIRAEVPSLTERVIAFMEDPENRDKVKQYLIKKLNSYADKTFSEIDYTLHDETIARYDFGDRANTIAGLTIMIEETDARASSTKTLLYIAVGLAALALLVMKTPSKIEISIFIGICLCLLLFGVSMSMIEIDARISSMKFTLLGEPIAFQDQVLYYKSKSILEVVQLMMQQGRLDVLLVGILVLLFSVLFPVGKLIAALIYTFVPSSHSNKFIAFMTFKTGKWSMADVMVVAIFMSYIGFSGIISEQLRQLEGITNNLDILTTNKSSLQTGFFLFASFTILSLLVTAKIQAPGATQEASN